MYFLGRLINFSYLCKQNKSVEKNNEEDIK